MNVRDRISDFPDGILHHILSFLATKDALRMSVLSKRWKYALDSYPILDFNWYDFFPYDFAEDQIFIVDLELENFSKDPKRWEALGKFINYVDASMSKFSKCKSSLQKFKLSILLPDLKLAHFLDKWVQLAIENGVKEIDFDVHSTYCFASKDLYCLPETIFSAASVTVLKLSGCKVKLKESFSVKLHSLKRLVLEHLHIPDYVVRELVAGCPSMEDISLNGCWGLGKVQVFGAPRLKKFEIRSYINQIESIEVAAPSLETCCLKLELENGRDVVKLDSCQGLKSLYLIGSVVTEGLFHDLVSNFPFLENLTIEDYQTLERLRISSWRLKNLCIRYCNNIVDVQIDTPNLLSCSYCGSVVPFSVVNPPSCQFQVDFYLEDTINSLWYMILKECLAKLNQLVYLHIYIPATKILFDLEDLRDNASPSAVDDFVLTIHPESPLSNYSAFMDGLFRFVRPKNLFIRSGNDQNKYVEHLFGFLKGGDLSCCNHENVKCWRHDLKELKVESFEGNADRISPLNKITLFTFIREQSDACYKMEWRS